MCDATVGVVVSENQSIDAGNIEPVASKKTIASLTEDPVFSIKVVALVLID